MADDTLGRGLIEGLGEVLAWKRGEIALEVVNLNPMTPERIKAIRWKAAHPGVEVRGALRHPGRDGEQLGAGPRGKPDPTARLLLKAIEADRTSSSGSRRRRDQAGAGLRSRSRARLASAPQA